MKIIPETRQWNNYPFTLAAQHQPIGQSNKKSFFPYSNEFKLI
jgi:hypothetical protein